MATFSIPDDKGKVVQLNDGDNRGNVYASFGIDFDEAGKVKVNAPTKVFFDKVTDADFSNKVMGFVKYDSDKILTFGGGEVRYFTADSYSTYTTSSGVTPTDASADDGAFYNGLILVSDGTTIRSSTNGVSWTNWWETTLGQVALQASSADEPRIMKVGWNGNLYISDNGNKIYYYTGAGAPVLTETTGVRNKGTLDISLTNELFTCMETSSTRMWIGTKNIGGEASLIEWDLSLGSETPNRVHKIGAEAVRAIVIYEDTPVAILSDGNVKIFDGVKFVDWEIMKIRVPKGKKLAFNFIHRNGWDIIDGLPHIAITGQIDSTGTKYERAAEQEWAMPSGIYCMDPDKGLYHRFAFGAGDYGAAGTTIDNYGEVAATDVGALVAIDSKTGKFLVSYETMLTDGTYNPALAYHTNIDVQGGKGWLATTFAMSFREAWKKIELFHKPLETGCKIEVYSRAENTSGKLLKGNWTGTTEFNAVTTGLDIQAGNLALVKMGNGSGQWLKVAGTTESSTVTTLSLEDPNTKATAGDYGTIEVFDFKFMGTIDDTQRDYHDFSVPQSELKRRRQFLFEFTQPAGTDIEVDYIIANT